MKGLIFTELLTMVEQTWGLEVLDKMLLDSEVATNGAYTSVGNYSSEELLALIGALSPIVEIPPNNLVENFGRHLAGTFVSKFPTFFADTNSVFDVLKRVDNHIHVEVRKLYPEADPPSFKYREVAPDILELHYESKRNMAILAQGIIAACGSYFNETLDISRKDDDSGVKFKSTITIIRKSHE